MYLPELVGFWYQSSEIILVLNLVTLVSKKDTEKSVSLSMVKDKCGSKELNICRISSALSGGRERIMSAVYWWLKAGVKDNLRMLVLINLVISMNAKIGLRLEPMGQSNGIMNNILVNKLTTSKDAMTFVKKLKIIYNIWKLKRVFHRISMEAFKSSA